MPSSRTRPIAALTALLLSATLLACGVDETEAPSSASTEDEAEERPLRNVARDPSLVPPPIRRSEPRTVEVDLAVREVVAELTPGVAASVWAFAPVHDGRVGKPTVPGPMVRVMEGDTVVLHLRNASDSSEPHNIDLHAVVGPGGGGAVTEVSPGEEATLRFEATRRGTYLYHCAAEGMPWEHVAHGMVGLIQVDPPGGLRPGFREYYVGQSEWYLGADSAGETTAGHPFHDLDEAQAESESPDFYTYNGHSAALQDPALFGEAISVDRGDRVRLFFANGGPNATANVHVVGQIFDRVYGGDPADAVRNEETVAVAPGSASVFELTADVPGAYELMDHAIYRASLGAMGTILVKPQCKDPERCEWPRSLYSPPAQALDAAAELASVVRLLRGAGASYASGDSERAGELVTKAYLDHFERIEGQLAAHDPALLESLEVAISTTLRERIEAGAPVEEVEALLDGTLDELERTEPLLQGAH